MARSNILLSLLKHVPTALRIFRAFQGGGKPDDLEKHLEAFRKKTDTRLTSIEEDAARLRSRVNRLQEAVELYRYLLIGAFVVAAVALLLAIIALAR